MKRYCVSGICFVPTEAGMFVKANSPEEAVEIAKAKFAENPMKYVDGNTGDLNLAQEWVPFASEDF